MFNELVDHIERRSRRAKIGDGLVSGFRVILNLFGSFKVAIKCVIVLVLALVGRVVTTNLRTGFVDAAHIVFAQVFAFGVHQQKPIIVFSENRRVFVKQVPAKIVEVLGRTWTINRQRKVPTALGGAMLAEHLVGL